MTSGTDRQPAAQAGTGNDPGAAGLRDLIQQAISAYELAATTQTRIAAQAALHHKQRLADLDAREAASTEQREESLRARQSTAEAEAERVKTLSALAGELSEAASSLLERAALAHVRGFGPGSTDVGPHVATDEQAAAAFAAAQVASANLRATLLRLAQEYLDSGDWPRTIEVVTPLTTGSSGPLASEATAVLRAASLGQVRELLSNSDPKVARTQAETWLRAYSHDTEMSSLLFQAAIELVEQAEASGDQLRGGDDIEALARQYGPDHPQLREAMRRRPQAAWRLGGARLRCELGGHGQPVRALAFTGDGQYLVSADDTEVRTWDIAASDRGRLVHTVPIQGTCGLAPDGSLALSKNGVLSRMVDGHHGTPIGTVAAHAFSGDSSLLAWAKRTMHWKLGSQYTFASDPHILASQLKISRATVERVRSQILRYRGPGFRASAIELSKVANATSLPDGYDGTAAPVWADFINSVSVFDVETEREICNPNLDPPHFFLDIAVSASGRKVAVLTPDGEVFVTDFDSGIQIHMFSVGAATSLLNSIAFSPGGDLILVAQAGSGAMGNVPAANRTTMTIWDISRGAVLWTWNTNRREGAGAFSPDGQLIATLAMDGTISLFDVRAEQALPEIGSLARFHGALTSPSLAFSPDGSRLAASGYRDVKVWGL